MNTKKLKQLVLDLAIHGKLVPQDPNDEPASELLARIKEEKLKTAKGKKTAISSDEIDEVPFDVPTGWCWTRLGDCFFMQAGKNIKAEDIFEIQTEENPYRCFGGNGLRGYVKSFNHSGCYPIVGRQGALCGNVNLADGDFYATEHAVPVHTFAGTDPIWAYHFLKILNLNQYATATAQPGLSVKVIEDVCIPLPPLAEQHRIVAAIEKWFAVIDQLESNEGDLKKSIEQTKKKVLDLAIHGKLVKQDESEEPASELLKRIKDEKTKTAKGKKTVSQDIDLDEVPFEVPKGWVWTTLGEIGKWQSGSTPSRSNKSYYGGTIPWLKTGDLNDGFITEIPEFITEEALKNTSVKLNPTDSVLIAMYGATIGKVGILTFPATTNQACCACSDYFIDKMYLFYFLIQEKDKFIYKAGGGAQPNISKEIIVDTFIPLPPLAEQHRIVAKVEEVFGELDKIGQMLG